MNILEQPKATIDTEFGEIIQKEFPEQAYIMDDGSIGFRSAKNQDYVLGSPDFPVAKYRELIVDTVENNLITIITAKTGTGKSTNVPQYLFENGFERVIVTQPRILAARELKIHVASDMADALRTRDHRLVGYQTAMEGDATEENAIVFETDGLQLMREIMGQGIKKDQVLVIDEYHERSVNMDALLAIAVEHGIRVVIMSATLDAEGISKHYQEVTQSPVPIIEIPGVAHEVVESEAKDLDDAVVEHAKEGKNILVFLPGGKEIKNVMSRVRRRVSRSYTLLALDGDQAPEEQRRVMGAYPGGKIIFSTSIGQTSITIPDIDVVIDCGFERTMTLDEHGKKRLATQPASNATLEQRRGRVGRTKPGEYILAQLRRFAELPSIQHRSGYDEPEIQRTPVYEMQLKLAAFGHSVLTLPFYQRPSDEEIQRSSEKLEQLQFFKKIGKTALDGYEITEMGQRASRLPLDPHSARMVLEARKYGPKVELQMMAAVAVMQRKGIINTAKGMENWRRLTKEQGSDIVAGIDFMVSALQRTEYEQTGVHIVKTRYDKALRTLEQLANRRNLNIYDLVVPDEAERKLLIKSSVAGADELYALSGKSYVDHNGVRRQLVNSSVIPTGSELLIGESLDLQQVRGKTIRSNPLITAASSVDYDTLKEVSPHRVSTVIKSIVIDNDGTPRTVEQLYFDQKPTRYEIEGVASPSPELQRFIIESIFSNKQLIGVKGENIKAARRLISGFRRLQHKTTEDLGIDYSIQGIVEKMLKESNYQSVAFDDVDPFIDLDAIENIIPAEIRNEVNGQAPDTLIISVGGREIELQVTYHDSAAYVTTQPHHYQYMPFTIGDNHKVYVKPTAKHADYKSLGEARKAYEEAHSHPRRQLRRGGTVDDGNDGARPAVPKKVSASAARMQPGQRSGSIRRGR